MLRLRMMRAPQKYVQGKDSLLQFHKEMTSLGDKWLFICSRSGYKMAHDKIEKSFEGTSDVRQYEIFGGVSSTGEIEKMREIVRENHLNVSSVWAAVPQLTQQKRQHTTKSFLLLLYQPL